MTPRLYFEDPLAMSFDASVVAHGERGVVLDRTAFYAEAGGQMADRGTLGDSKVVDVQSDDHGVVLHVIDGPLPAVGARVHGEVDGPRRREHMALHTGQHMLSHALWDLFDAVTVSSRLGENGCTIDVDRAGLTLEQAEQAQALVLRIIDEDRPVRAFFPTPEELERMPLRKKPKVESGVRVVVVEGFDATPCGGTHCTHTAQVELVWVESVERYKGGTRVTFSAGPRARRALFERASALRGIANGLRCAPMEAAELIEKQRAKLEEARTVAGQAWSRVADGLAAIELAKPGPIAIVVDEEPLIEPLVARLAVNDRVAAIALRAQDNLRITIVRGPDSSVDCGAVMKRLGGRGGGRPHYAGGQLAASVDLRAALALAVQAS